jgi:hypothetical protein
MESNAKLKAMQHDFKRSNVIQSDTKRRKSINEAIQSDFKRWNTRQGDAKRRKVMSDAIRSNKLRCEAQSDFKRFQVMQ